MALSSGGGGDQFDPSSRGRRSTAASRRVSGSRTRASGDDALRLAVQTLSAEISWFFANDAQGRGVAAAAIDPTTRRPRS